MSIKKKRGRKPRIRKTLLMEPKLLGEIEDIVVDHNTYFTSVILELLKLGIVEYRRTGFPEDDDSPWLYDY